MSLLGISTLQITLAFSNHFRIPPRGFQEISSLAPSTSLIVICVLLDFCLGFLLFVLVANPRVTRTACSSSFKNIFPFVVLSHAIVFVADQ